MVMIMVRAAVPPGQPGRNGHTRARCAFRLGTADAAASGEVAFTILGGQGLRHHGRLCRRVVLAQRTPLGGAHLAAVGDR
jgi:hypothetical protein